MQLTFAQKELSANESPLKIAEGTTLSFSCVFWDNVGSTSAKVYRDGEDVTSTIMPSGSVTEAANVATLKPATAWSGGFTYVVVVTTTIAGDVWTKRTTVVCRRAAEAS
jgi:hypothetical protein